jgi:DNA-binding response OmpR family regulator
MPAILTVDDSRAIRTIVAKQVKDLGFDVLEAEDGVQGLERLAADQVDLVLLDVTMPNMDGPTMLERLRAAGNPVPVIMLTSEAKRSTVAGAMRLGIADYILKPFKPEELRAKVLAVLQGEPGGVDVVAQASAPAEAQAPAASSPAGRFVDVLVVDDMENVAKKLRAMLPPHVSMASFTSAHAALAACREKVFRVILVDTEIPDVNSAVLAQQLRVLQPNAVVVALALRTVNDVSKEVREQGFDDVLCKPFRPESLDDFLLQYFDNQEFLVVDDDVLRVASFSGRSDRVERFYGRLSALYAAALENVAAACHDEIVLDVGTPPLEGDRLPKFVNDVAARSREFGMTLAVVGSPDVEKLLAGYTETKDLRVYRTVHEARAGAGRGEA